MAESRLRCTAIKVEPVGGTPFLLVQIDVDCPTCGVYRIELAGHHLRAVRDALIQTIDQHPTLTGTDADVKVLARHEFKGKGPADPSAN